MVATAPAERPSSARPRAAGDAPVCSLTAGTRTAQLANMNPCAANTAHSAIRSRPRSPGPPGRRRDVTSACWILLTGGTKSGYVTLGLALRRGQVLLRPRQVRALGRVAGPRDRGAVGGVRLGPAAQPPQQVGADRVEQVVPVQVQLVHEGQRGGGAVQR